MKLMKRISLVFIAMSVLFVSVTILSAPVQATVIDCEDEFLSNNTDPWWDPCDSTSCSILDPNQLSVESNRDYRKDEILNRAQFIALETNLIVYKKSASAAQVPWQLLAAIHFTETGFVRSGPANGFGPYQIKSQTFKIGAYAEKDFQDATDKAASYIKKLAGDRDLSEPENVKFVLFKHSGAQDIYKEQAKSLGLTDKEAANGEGSPYVMNGADAQRDPTLETVQDGESWGELKGNGATELTYPAGVYYGAYIIYASIAGIKLSGECAGGLVAGGMNLEEAIEFMNTYRNSSNSASFVGGAYSHRIYGPLANCVSFSNYFVNKYTTLKSTLGNGTRLVGNFLAANPDVPNGAEPQPYAMFSSPRPSSDGHTGIILGVDPDAGTMIIGDQGWGSPLRDPREVRIEDFNRTYGPLKYAYLADYLRDNL
jgi:hypothetical protein